LNYSSVELNKLVADNSCSHCIGQYFWIRGNVWKGNELVVILATIQRQSELFVHELMDLREHSSILTNGMTLQRSETDSLTASVCCT